MVIFCNWSQYNSKVKLGRGFTLEELKEAGINRKFALTVGISVDHRRTNHCQESLELNVQRLKDYKSRLIVFPRRMKKVKNGDATKAETDEAMQLTGPVAPLPTQTPAVTFAEITEDMKKAGGYSALRLARSNARLVGIRMKQAKAAAEKKEE